MAMCVVGLRYGYWDPSEVFYIYMYMYMFTKHYDVYTCTCMCMWSLCARALSINAQGVTAGRPSRATASIV